MDTSILHAIIGGSILGLSVSVMLLFTGRIAGISGITNAIFTAPKAEKPWRIAFVAGLILGGLFLILVGPNIASSATTVTYGRALLGGLFVGFGTLLGSGCTSGHGICGLTRLSPRSFVATLTFMATAIVTVYFMNHILGGFTCIS